MRVMCNRLPAKPGGRTSGDNPWVTLGHEYIVISMLISPGADFKVQIITDDGLSAAWFDVAIFATTDTSIPSNWNAKIDKDGKSNVAPLRWMQPGFWELLYDGDVDAQAIYREELKVILSSSG